MTRFYGNLQKIYFSTAILYLLCIKNVNNTFLPKSFLSLFKQNFAAWFFLKKNLFHACIARSAS